MNKEHFAIVKAGNIELNRWRANNPDTQLDLERACFANMDLSNSNLASANLIGAKLHNTILTGADLGAAIADGADLSRATLKNSRLEVASLKGADLKDAKLNGADLGCAFLDNANLQRVNLTCAQVNIASLNGADLTDANLTGANLSDSDLSDANLTNVDFTNANLESAIFYRAILSDAIFTDAKLTRAKFDFSFFISYSHSDEDFARRLFSRLKDEGLRVWYAPENMRAGQTIHAQIEKAIHAHDKFLLVLSERSMNSDWVKSEIQHALQRAKKEGRQILFPIRTISYEKIEEWKSLDVESGIDIAREVRQYFIPDFSSWKEPADFESAFKKLVEDLKSL